MLLEILPSLYPFTMVSVTKNILPLCGNTAIKTELEKTVEKLMYHYKTTFDFCVLQTITSIQVLYSSIRYWF